MFYFVYLTHKIIKDLTLIHYCVFSAVDGYTKSWFVLQIDAEFHATLVYGT